MTHDVTQERQLEIDQIRSIMSTEGGRSFMFRLLSIAGTHTDGFNESPTTHAYNAGRRSVGVWIENELKECVQGSYQTMIKESLDAAN